jgi:hypothetical protein
VAPFINKKIVVVGSRTEGLRTRFPDTTRFSIQGTVEDLGQWYGNAIGVLSPVFSGGGMKVKNVEALAYGKRILATPFSAIGFEREVAEGSICIAEDGEAFIRMINAAPREATFSASIRDNFLVRYRSEALRQDLLTFLEAHLPHYVTSGI